MKVSVQYAAEHFEDLVSAVNNGEAVEIASAGQPALLLVRSSGYKLATRASERMFGAGKAFTRLPDPDELERIDGVWKREIEEKSIGAGTE